MPNTNTIPLFKVAMSPRATSQVINTLKSGYVAQGPKVDKFESMLKDYWFNPNVVTTNSCTSALHLAFHLIKSNASNLLGNTVLACPLTCAAGIFPILANGFDIRWADVDKTLNIDLDDVWTKLDKDTQILTFVHWGGMPINFDKLAQIKVDYEKKFGRTLFIVEDCAHAINSQWDTVPISKLMTNNFKCYSFQAIKHLTTGDGGALICPPFYYKQARLLRWFGLDRDNKQDFRSCQDIKQWGFKFHMNDIAACLGISNMVDLNNYIKLAELNAGHYDANFCKTPQIELPERDFKALSSWWLYTILVKDRLKFIRYMNAKGIQCSPVHNRNDTHSCMKSYAKPVSGYIDYVNEHMISIPVGYWVTENERDFIVRKTNNYESDIEIPLANRRRPGR